MVTLSLARLMATPCNILFALAFTIACSNAEYAPPESSKEANSDSSEASDAMPQKASNSANKNQNDNQANVETNSQTASNPEPESNTTPPAPTGEQDGTEQNIDPLPEPEPEPEPEPDADPVTEPEPVDPVHSVRQANLITYLSFDNQDFADNSSNNHNVTVGNAGSAPLIAKSDHILGYHMDLTANNTDKWLHVTDNSSANNKLEAIHEELTVILWYYTEYDTQGVYNGNLDAGLVCKGFGEYTNQMQFLAGSAGSFRVTTLDPNTNDFASQKLTFAQQRPGYWVFLAGTFSSNIPSGTDNVHAWMSVDDRLTNWNTGINQAVDGMQHKSGRLEGKIRGLNADHWKGISVGKRCNIDDRFFNGKIDNVRIYNKALSFQEIQAIYNDENPYN